MQAQPRILALFGGAVLFGQERGNIEALAALQERGCKVLCLVRDERWSVHIPPALDARGLQWIKVPYIEHRVPGRMRYFIFRNPLAFVRANWHFRRVVRDFRPTHIHTFNPVYVLNFLIGLALVPMPMIYRAGDEPTVHNRVWRAVWRFIVRRTGHFVANSQFVARSLCSHGVTESRVTVIYNAPPRGRPSRGSEDFWSDGNEGPLISYVGQISEHKGVHLLVDAFRVLALEFPTCRLLIAGRISGWSGDSWARELRDVTSRDPVIGARVTFAGEITDVPGLLAHSSVHVAPSLFQDPSPNVVMEAKQAACPSVVFPRGGMPELVEDGVDGFVCSDATPDALVVALRCYLSDPELARSHGGAALASLGRLGAMRFGERWLAVYSNSGLSDLSSQGL